MKHLLFLPLVVSLSAVDFDIILPPASPYESLFYLDDTIHRHGYIKTSSGSPDVGKDTGGTSMTGKNRMFTPLPALPPVRFAVSSNIPVGVADFKAHVGEDSFLKVAFLKDNIAGHLHYEETDSKRTRIEAQMKMFIHMLLKLFHYNRTVDTFDLLACSLYGAPAGISTAYMNGLSEPLHLFSSLVHGYLRPESRKLIVDSSKGSFAKMVENLALLELASYQPFSSLPFAPGLDNFDRELIEGVVKELVSYPNKRVGRNAVYYLGRLGMFDELFDILKKEKDGVSRVRALFFLTAAGYSRLTSHLLERIKYEEDPVFRVMMIDALGRVGSKDSFSLLLELLKGIKGETKVVSNPVLRDREFAEAISIVRAATLCLDPEDDSMVEEFVKECYQLYRLSDDSGFFTDPTAEPPESMSALETQEMHMLPASHVARARYFTFRQFLEIALAVAGEKEFYNDISGRLKSSANNIRGSKYRIAPVEGGGLKGFISTSSIFVVQCVGRFNRGRDRVGKWFLEELLKSGCENVTVLKAAVAQYCSIYPGEFEGVVIGMVRNLVDISLLDYALKMLYSSGYYSAKTDRLLEGIVRRYRGESDTHLEHLTTLGVYYLGQRRGLKTRYLSKVLAVALSRLKEQKDYDAELNQRSPWGTTISYKSNLAQAVIEVLRFYEGKDPLKILLGLSGHRDVGIRRMIARSLGSHEGSGVVESLLKMQHDPDGWVRVNSYLSLRRITGVESNIDWYFSDRESLITQASNYRNRIRGHVPN